MPRNYIDFISAYCDTWCERCAFTERCSHFAVTSAMGMLDGDLDAAMELAIGQAQVPGEAPQETLHERMADAVAGVDEPTDTELDALGREGDERRERLRRHVLAESSYDYIVAARRWFDAKTNVEMQDPAWPSVAVETIHRYLFPIHSKIMRAMLGRDEDPKGRFWESQVQNDWNGSAKLAILLIEGSENAWRELAAVLPDESAAVIADSLVTLRDGMRKEFPRAMDFRRPGFDA